MPNRSVNLPFHVVVLSALILLSASLAVGQAITTYHVDNNRTGWNSHETVLTPANVGSSSFGLAAEHHLRPIRSTTKSMLSRCSFPRVNITAGNHQGVHDVVYVATESNSDLRRRRGSRHSAPQPELSERRRRFRQPATVATSKVGIYIHACHRLDPAILSTS
jgi:hypothetical protein